MSVKDSLISNGYLATSPDFSGFIFRLKDCYAIYNNFSLNQISFVDFEHISGHIDFLSVYLSEYNQSIANKLHEVTDLRVPHTFDSICVVNSACNLSCSYCLANMKGTYNYPSVKDILSAKSMFKSIDYLYITGGEPTVDLQDVLGILHEASPKFKQTFMYSNGYGFSDDLFKTIEDLRIHFSLIMGINSSKAEGSHRTLNDFYNNVYPLIENKPAIDVSLNVFPTDDLDPDGVLDFITSVNNRVKIKLTPFFKCVENEEHVMDTASYLKKLFKIIDVAKTIESPNFGGRDINNFNFLKRRPNRAQLTCISNHLHMINGGFANCAYAYPTFKEQYPTPFDLVKAHIDKSPCYKCDNYPLNCQENIGSVSCKAFHQKCLTCPSMYKCYLNCCILKSPTEDACLIETFLRGFHMWVSIKNKTREEVLEHWNQGSKA